MMQDAGTVGEVHSSAGSRPAIRRGAWSAALHICRIALGALFLISGVLKIVDPEGFTREMLQYGILSGLPATLFALVLLPAEVILGAALLLNYRVKIGLMAAIALLALFIAAIGYALATDKQLEGCGCFGRVVQRSPARTLTDDVGFLALGLVGLFALSRAGDSSRREPARAVARRVKPALVGAVAAASALFVVAAPRLPIDDAV